MLRDKRILLVIGGGIAAYKTLDLIRRLAERGARTRAILTRAGAEFVTPLSVGALTGDKVYTDLFSLTDEAEMGHIELSRDADLVVVAPATADLMAKMAQGLANDLASTALLATDKRILIAPAMNVRMWLHPATQRNIATLTGDGVAMVGPNEGGMACGEFGPGRMAEPLEIVAAIESLLAGGPTALPLPAPAPKALEPPRSAPAARPLAGLKALVTSGPTREPIDPVRYLSNHSSGKQGHAVAAALAAAGAEVTLVHGPVALQAPTGVTAVPVETARDMLAACERALPVDIGVFAAAVADWRVDTEAAHKLKKSGDAPPALALVENPDILATLARHPTQRPRLVVGFAAETADVIAYAEAKRVRKGADLIVANDVSPGTGVFGGDRNTVHLVSGDGVESWPTLGKDAVAARLVDAIARRLGRGGPA